MEPGGLGAAQEWPHPLAAPCPARSQHPSSVPAGGQIAQARAEQPLPFRASGWSWLTMANIPQGWTRVEQGRG
ncbi:MAG: hypothetical protein U0401_21280 [Anaerolineae bacterium]